MSKYVKQLEMDHLRRNLEGVEDLLIVNTVGLDGHDSNTLRLELRKKGVLIQVVKNTLARKIFAEKGLPPLNGVLEGASAIAWGAEGVIELAREISSVARKYKNFSIKGGYAFGQAFDAKGIEAVSKLPNRLEMLSQVLGQILSPAMTVVAQLLGPASQVVGQVKSIADEETSAPSGSAA